MPQDSRQLFSGGNCSRREIAPLFALRAPQQLISAGILSFEKLKKSFEEAVAIESGELAPARVTIREVPEKNVRKVRINIMLDEDIIEYFKQRAALPNAAPYQTQINQALREIISGKSLSDLPLDDQSEAMAERIAEKVAMRLHRREKKKAA
jgi:uncharacterized protein (DUF4415 family)